MLDPWKLMGATRDVAPVNPVGIALRKAQLRKADKDAREALERALAEARKKRKR